jgi:hypothetical protein
MAAAGNIPVYTVIHSSTKMDSGDDGKPAQERLRARRTAQRSLGEYEEQHRSFIAPASLACCPLPQQTATLHMTSSPSTLADFNCVKADTFGNFQANSQASTAATAPWRFDLKSPASHFPSVLAQWR